ncbi:1652_t:CDS:2 [Funneliformis mosseae]|uniref:GPI mannosyltransferase 1 n=1 Tax=Funneliformis mosseae TaxID=27381 RepID=A0A9N9FKY3_FUNMO|nr:1652_t:CDS:2 [Funneliformis mosseae]
MHLPRLNFTILCLMALLLRLGMLIYGEWQDAHMQVKYTDIDYKVFSDAARFVIQGESPYKRATYRYTPLLAFLLTPNIYIHKSFGKFLFVFADIVVGVLIYRILRLRGLRDQKAVNYSAIWLLNPVVSNISTRGNAESLLGAAVLLTLYLVLVKKIIAASILYGISVHLKVYPIIYAISLLVLLDDEDYRGLRRKGKEKELDRDSLKYWTGKVVRFVNPTRIKFGLISGGVFFLLNGIMYYLYSQEFLNETYLYHVTRKDHRHNFSLWFYYIYLTFDISKSSIMALLAFLPQISIVTLLGIVFGNDIFFACFVQTFAFVIYNKVCTSQYFMWYICLFPLIIQSTTIKFFYKGLFMLFAWIGGQALWLYQAYNLEFLGENTFFNIWLASIVFFMANVWILTEFVQNHVYEKCFDLGKIRKIWEVEEEDMSNGQSSNNGL